MDVHKYCNENISDIISFIKKSYSKYPIKLIEKNNILVITVFKNLDSACWIEIMFPTFSKEHGWNISNVKYGSFAIKNNKTKKLYRVNVPLFKAGEIVPNYKSHQKFKTALENCISACDKWINEKINPDIVEYIVKNTYKNNLIDSDNSISRYFNKGN